MANGHGGARTPANPAPVSGPGALSRRTDGTQPARYVSGQDYGDGQELMTQQQAAPMAGPGPVPAGDMAMLQASPQGLFDPSQEGRPLTTGQPFGAGAGPEVLASVNAGPTRNKLVSSLPMLMMAAERPDASRELRALVTYLRSQV